MSRYLFRAWLELPYLIGVHYDEVYPATYMWMRSRGA